MGKVEFIEVEWFGREDKIGIVLTYVEHDGFKARMAPLPGDSAHGDESLDIEWLMQNAAKIPFEWAWGIFRRRIVAESIKRNLADETYRVIRYDGRNYNTDNLMEII